MRKITALIAGVSAVAVLMPAQAQNYNSAACQNAKRSNQTVGVVAGALLGGLAGGAIGNNVGDDDEYRRRGFDELNFREVRNLRRTRNRNILYEREDNSSERVAIGAVLGAAAGGFAGYHLAGNRTECPTVYGPHNTQPAPASYPTSTYPTTTSSYPTTTTTRYPTTTTTRYPTTTTTRYPTTTRTYPSSSQVECQTVYQETRLPNGQVMSEPVQACRTGPNGAWEVSGTLAGGSLY